MSTVIAAPLTKLMDLMLMQYRNSPNFIGIPLSDVAVIDRHERVVGECVDRFVDPADVLVLLVGRFR